MQLFLARHGQTALNTQGRFLGQVDDPLDEMGTRQVQALAARLEDEHISAVVSSDLSRAMGTAIAIADLHELTVQVDRDLQEINMGSWEGKLVSEVKQTEPQLFDEWLRDPVQYFPIGGESLEAMRTRLERALTHWQERYPTRPGEHEPRVVWVTHSACIGVLLCHLLGLPLAMRRHFSIQNASLSLIHLVSQGQGTSSVLYSLNDTGHLWVRGFSPKPPHSYLYLPHE